MRFFANIDGLIWECNSIGEYIETVFCTCLGRLIAWLVIAIIIFICILEFVV